MIVEARWAAVVALVEPEARLRAVRDLDGGLANLMTVLDVEAPGGAVSRVVVRRARHPERERRSLSTEDEYRLVSRLHDQGLPVPRPRLVAPAGELLGQPFAVYEFVEGSTRFTTDDPAGVGRAYADQLAAIHRLEAGAVAGVPVRTWADELRWHLDTNEDEVDDSLREGLVKDILGAERARWERGPVQLLHGDFWPGNVLWEGQGIVAVIDWASATLGDPLADVGITRLDLLWSFGPDAMAAFTERYLTASGIDPTDLPVWDLVASMRPAGVLSAWAADWADHGRPDITTATLRAAHTWFLDEALAALDR